jgi:hypothetical protein
MTREDIIRIYNQVSDELCDGKEWAWTGVEEPLQRFAALVAEAEREACARVCEMQENRIVQTHPARIEFDPNSMMARNCAAAIRARGSK